MNLFDIRGVIQPVSFPKYSRNNRKLHRHLKKKRIRIAAHFFIFRELSQKNFIGKCNWSHQQSYRIGTKKLHLPEKAYILQGNIVVRGGMATMMKNILYPVVNLHSFLIFYSIGKLTFWRSLENIIYYVVIRSKNDMSDKKSK